MQPISIPLEYEALLHIWAQILVKAARQNPEQYPETMKLIGEAKPA